MPESILMPARRAAVFCWIDACPAIALATADLPILQKTGPLCSRCLSGENIFGAAPDHAY